MKKIFTFWLASFSIIGCLAQSSVWEISKNGHIIYLGGSIHTLRDEDFPLPEEYDIAFDRADCIMFEADIRQASDLSLMQKIIKLSTLSDGQTLQTILDKDVYDRLAAQCTKMSFPIDNLINMKPGVVFNVLFSIQMQQLGFTPQGVDLAYLTIAAEAGKEIRFLETIDSQIELLTNIGVGYENEYVKYSLDDWDNIEKQIPVLIESLKSGKLSLLLQDIMSMKKLFPSVYEDLLLNRNKAWIPRIEAFFDEQKTAFIIVGMAHLPGDDGLLELLQNKGYKIKQLQ